MVVYSISIYKDKKEKIIIIPHGFDKNGIRTSLNKPRVIENPYNLGIIGKNIKESFKDAINSTIAEIEAEIDVNIYELITGIKSWSKFSKEHSLVNGMFYPEKGYTFQQWIRQKNGAYMSGDKQMPEFEIGLNATDQEIGEIVMKAFSLLE